MSILISLIVPLYNKENYINRAINSVLYQNLKEIEIIVINDGSTDNSLLEISRFQDERIRIVNQENQGPSGSRNNGLELARGQYIMFLDSDDELSSNGVLKLLYNTIKLNNLDILIFDHNVVIEDKKKIKVKKKNLKLEENKIYSSVKEKKEILNMGVIAWNKIYRREFLENYKIRFPLGVLYEDIPFFWEAVIHSNKISYLRENLYNYYRIPNSIMNSSFSKNQLDDLFKSIFLVKEKLEHLHLYKEYQYFYEMVATRSFLHFFKRYLNNNKYFFNLMSSKLDFIEIKTLKKHSNFFYYFKYKSFLKKQYWKYKLFFSWF